MCCSELAFVITFDLSYCRYMNLETFIIDVNLVFDNCEKFNEDNSDIGRAGHKMRRFFQSRWTELLRQNSLKPGLDTWDMSKSHSDQHYTPNHLIHIDLWFVGGHTYIKYRDNREQKNFSFSAFENILPLPVNIGDFFFFLNKH